VKYDLDRILGGPLAATVDWARRHARQVVALHLLLTAACALLAATRLGVNMDNKRLLAPDLPFQQAAARFAHYFPSLDDALLVVVDADSADSARKAARRLAERLARDRDNVRDAYVPAADPFFERHGLLYRSAAELDDFADHLARMQPVIADLSGDPSIANLARLIHLGLEEHRKGGDNGEQLSAVLDQIRHATVRVFAEFPVSVSWEDLMLQGSALDQARRQVVVVDPVLEFDKLLAAGNAIAAIRQAAVEEGLIPERGVNVRITGNPALNYEEMLGLAWDIGISGVFSYTVVTVIAFFAFRSLRLVAAAALTLLSGLIWTAAFAAASVGSLNVLSIAFGVMFIGLGIDYAIHLGMQFSDRVHRGQPAATAWRQAVRAVGSSLALCAVTTAIGFFAFVPTDYRGVAELGLISSGGVGVIFLQTFTFFPAMVTVLMGDRQVARAHDAFHLHLTPPRVVMRHPGVVAAVAFVAALAALTRLPEIRFDSHVVRMRNPKTESVRAFNDLLATSETSPWSADVVATDLEHAGDLARRLRRLDSVEAALTLRDYVPAEQEEKREILAEAALLLDAPGGRRPADSALSASEQVGTLRDLHAALSAEWLERVRSPLGRSAQQLRAELERFLDRVSREGDAETSLADLERILLGNFEAQLERLKLALRPDPVALEDLPPGLSQRMVSEDGHARVQIFPREELGDSAAMARFVDAVRDVAPGATGVSVNLVEFGRATARSLRQALGSAFVAIAVLIFVLWRRLRETLLVLIPLLLSAVLATGLMVLLDMPFNFVNVVVLPLLLGIGVDSGIHLVHLARELGPDEELLLESTTARAVFYSALTSTVSFGSLAFSHHRGLSSLGTLLVAGMAVVLVCNLVILPALVVLWSPGRSVTSKR
jgi:hopanoid biosynthesis associated RND transporter like protein HpnN